jgi:acetoin utilization protein AcuB
VPGNDLELPMPAPALTVSSLMVRSPITAASDATVAEVMETMERHRIHHVLITQDGRLTGILSDRDLLTWLPSPAMGDAARALSGRLALLTVDLLMTRRPLSVGPDMAVDDAVALMSETGVHALPVVDAQNQPLGIVTLRDVASGLLHACMT